MNNLIVYIGSFQFPLGDAVAKRAFGLGKCFREIGYDVAFIGENDSVDNHCISEDKYYDGFMYCSLHKTKSAKEHYEFRKELKLVRERLEQWSTKYNISMICFCGTRCALFANGIVNISKKMGIPVIADSMDWLSSNTGNIIFDTIKTLDMKMELEYVNRRCDGAITISSYLSDYYCKHGLKTVVIPPVSPYEKEENEERTSNEITKLIYAGFPCRMGERLVDPSLAKDRLDIAVDLLSRAHKNGVMFQLNVYGPTKDQYLTAFPEQKDIVNELVCDNKLDFKGLVSEDVVKKAIKDSDYSIVLRDKNRITNAGFSTKISESIVLGTPVITTDTSDVLSYMKNGIDCYILNLELIEESEEKLISILNEPFEQRITVSDNAKNNQSFLPFTYNEKLAEWCSKILIKE